MNCSTFRSNINKLLEGQGDTDFEISMERHMDKCSTCKTFYEEELEMDKDFIEFFSTKNIDFKSSRMEIIDQIDKNKYKNNYFIKIYRHFGKYMKGYMAIAAVLIFVIMAKPYFLKFMSKSIASSTTTANSTASIAVDKGNEEEIKFIRMSFTANKDISTKLSGDGKYRASLKEGNVIEIKELATGKQWYYSILNNFKKVTTIEWIPGRNMLFIIVGEPRLDVEGGVLYAFDINTGICTPVYIPSELELIKSVQFTNKGINAELVVFEDKSLTKFHFENIKIATENLMSMEQNLISLPREASIIYEYQENINNNRLEAALKLVDSRQILEKTFDYNDFLYGISNMKILSLKKLTTDFNENEVSKTAFQKEGFLATIGYNLNKEKHNSIKEGENKKIIILVKDKSWDPWRIGEIRDIK